MFAVAWTDGRICICNITKLPIYESGSTPASAPGSEYEWNVIKSFHTQYSFFQLNLLRFKNLNPIIETTNRETETSLSNIESNGDLENFWQSVHGDNEEDTTLGESGLATSMSDLFLVVSSHTGHTIFISLIPSDFGEEIISSSTTSPFINQRKLYCYDSRHSLHSQVVKFSLIGRINHITNSPSNTSPSTDLSNSTNGSIESQSDTRVEYTYCLLYVTARGECWIVKDIEKELSQCGPPIIPHIQFTTSDIEKANRIVRMWNIISSIPRNKTTSTSSPDSLEGESGDQSNETQHQNEGITLIQRLLATSIEDLQQMIESTSLTAWKELEE